MIVTWNFHTQLGADIAQTSVGRTSLTIYPCPAASRLPPLLNNEKIFPDLSIL